MCFYRNGENRDRYFREIGTCNTKSAMQDKTVRRDLQRFVAIRSTACMVVKITAAFFVAVFIKNGVVL